MSTPDAGPTDHEPVATLDDHRLAADLAAEAGRMLVDLRARMLAPGSDPRRVRDAGDRRAHDLLLSRLAQARRDDAVLSEEGHDDDHRLAIRRVWVIDPLDGTREFGEDRRTDWAVHVALVVDHEPVVGAVALPARGIVCTTVSPPPLAETPADPPRLVVSRSRMPPTALRLAARMGAETVPLGSAGAKTLAVVLGDAEIYAHDGGQYEWDSAAPVAVARAAGLHCSRLDGSPLRYNRADPRLPDLLVCRPELAERALRVLADERARAGRTDRR